MNGASRLLVSGVAVTALLALVALASRAHRPGGGAGGGGGHVPALVGTYLGVTMFVLMLLAAVLFGVGFASGRRKALLEGRTNWRRTLLAITAVAAALLLVLTLSDRLRSNSGNRRVTPPVVLPGSRPAKLQKQREDRQTEPNWLTFLIVGSVVLGVAGAAALAVRHRRRHGDELEAEAALSRALDEVLADTLDDLRAERDPRKAVISAYARMEQTFAAYRVPRDPAETPLEYVARALESLSVSGHAVRRLTLLFERAKFSTHAVDAGMKDNAIETLASLRAELEAAHEEAAA